MDGEWQDWVISDDSECEFNAILQKWTKPKTRECSEPKFGGEFCAPDPITGESDKGTADCEPKNGGWSNWEIVDENCKQNDEGN